MAATEPFVGDLLMSFPTPRSLWKTLNRNWLVGYEGAFLKETFLKETALEKIDLEKIDSEKTDLASIDLEKTDLEKTYSVQSNQNFVLSKINQEWLTAVESRRAKLERCKQLPPSASRLQRPKQSASDRADARKYRPLLLIAEPDPLDCLASFWAALLAGWSIALANPSWGDRERAAACQTLRPDLVWPIDSFPCWSAAPFASDRDRTALSSGLAAILIPTGGTSGQIRFACHTWTTLMTAASSFCQTFQQPIHTYCVLPVYHVSGLMQLLRAWFSQAQVVIAPFKSLVKSLENQPALIANPTDWYISLVPTQLARLLAVDKGSWLSQFRAVLLGGAPPWPDILTQAVQQKIPVYLSYGMTETAAMVTVQRLEPALNVQNPGSGSALPHAKLSIEVEGKAQPPNMPGQVVVRSWAIARGYYSACESSSPKLSRQNLEQDLSEQDREQELVEQAFYTDDLGYLTAAGQLHIIGRASDKIISGGENIFPAEVEAALRSTGQVKDVCVFGLPDPLWGEAVVAAFVPANLNVTAASLQAALSGGTASLLSRYKHPKRWIPLSILPRNAQGKLLKSVLLAQIRLYQADVPS